MSLPDPARTARAAASGGATSATTSTGSSADPAFDLSHEAMVARLIAARERVRGHAHRTPVMTSLTLDERTGARTAFKCESLQRMGAFKFRGAYNTIAQIPEAVRARGVVAFSSGNHAQAVALVAQEFGIPAVIVMPSWAPQSKLDATRGYGAEIVFYDQVGEDRDGLAERLSRERGLTLVPPFNHPEIVAGAATAADELFEEVGDLDLLLVPLGGGGLLSGSALAARVRCPSCRVIGVEPEAGDDGARSFRSGRLERIETPETIADGARTQSLGPVTFELIRRYVADIVTVPDAELIRAMAFAIERMKLMVEPTGVLALAALMSGRVEANGQRVGVMISGGNADVAQIARWLAGLADDRQLR
ncbi:MAG: threo-3-hydroxy-L-aspartate ammonia-lyase [Candidatus Eisenbacteria bacterium]|nr:threo-3-hydroxy-L-aspartate ammonia-lyase [Candidatus Eisenbacteria bacterium]